MKSPLTISVARPRALSLAVLTMGVLVSQAWAQPSNRPLLTGQTGARPNLMIALDNSGSMAFPYHETYAIQFADNNDNPLRFCGGARTFAVQAGVGNVLNGQVDFNQPAGNRCFRTNAVPNADGSPNFGPGWGWVGDGVAYAPARTASNNFNAMRSSDVNPVYYNPRTTYAPRLGPDYVALDRPAGINFVSNAATHRTTASFYRVWRNGVTGELYTINTQKPAPTAPAWLGAAANVYNLGIMWAFPTHLEHNVTGGATPTFVYAHCRDTAGNSTVQRDPQGKEIGCSSTRNPPFTPAAQLVTTVFAPGHPSAAGNTITLPPDHQRTDCGEGATTCTNEQERINILNWYHWYSTRQLATSTAIGQSLASTDFQNRLRIGYLPINDFTLANDATLGGNTNLAIQRNPAIATPTANAANAQVLRGVRLLNGGSPENTQLYSWLNGIQSRGGTPLHNAVTRVAEYFAVPNGALENPWAINPSQPATAETGTNPEMTCRRSFNLLFSDGGWTIRINAANPVAPTPAGRDYDNENADEIFPRSIPPAANEPFRRYLPAGINSADGRLAYTPFPSTGTGGLADLTARYFWHSDLRPGLRNEVLTRPGQPTYWQNMTTYTVGYMIRPSGNTVTNTGLTFRNIDQYITDYQRGVAATPPAWPTGNLLGSTTTAPLVDDFIHAGFSGGGKSFSATTAEDVRTIFNTILADILSAAGQDAGVSVSSAGGDATTLTDELKYTVSYNTLNNAGDISARELDAGGDETSDIAWRASEQMPTPAARNVFTMHGLNDAVPFSGRFDDLETDIQDALKLDQPDGDRIPDDASFINYLRGDNNALDSEGRLFRQRTSTIAAMVNPPSMYMGGDQDYAYDLQDAGGVEGRGSYEEFANRKRGYTASLFVATNAGVMHSLNSATGVEQSAFMPRRSLKRMLNFAKEPYNFEYVLDGPISPNDIFDRRLEPSLSATEKWRAWRQIGVGAGGRGEPLIYAVGSPFNRGTGAIPANRGPNEEDILWETGPELVNSTEFTMGYISNSARSGQTEDLSNALDGRGEWIVAINNGHYNGEPNGEKSGLIVLNALTGVVLRTIPLPSNYSAGRGLSGVTLVRSYGANGRVTHAYAGDANGNLWRFNLTGEPSTWHVEYDRPIFTTDGNRPIYGHPAWQKHGNGGYIVVFASGIMLEEGDLDDMRQQVIYGIWDRRDEFGTDVGGTAWAPVAQSELQQQSVVEGTSVLVPGSAPSPNDSRWYQITNNQINWQTQRGWFMNLGWRDAGERNIADVRNVGTSVLVTTTVLRRPDDVESCSRSALPVNYMYVLNAQTGSQNLSRSFDVNADSRLDQYAVQRLAEGGYSRGVSVTSYYSRSDGSPLVEDGTDTHVSDPLDPTEPRSQDIRRREQAAEEHGESYSEKNGPRGCRNIRGVALGTVSESVSFGVGCPPTAWSRTQFQLSEPPKN